METIIPISPTKEKAIVWGREELEKMLDESPQNQDIPFTLWTTTLVQYIIYRSFNVSYNQSAIWKIVIIRTEKEFEMKLAEALNNPDFKVKMFDFYGN